jgi:hypothetical protein
MADENNEILDLTADGVVFAEWKTRVENDDLSMVSVNYVVSDYIQFPQEEIELRCPGTPEWRCCDLEAHFLSREKKAVARFVFKDVLAFRVLDEHGLLELWNASSISPRPAGTTFRVRGHRWQAESELVWIMAGRENYSATWWRRVGRASRSSVRASPACRSSRRSFARWGRRTEPTEKAGAFAPAFPSSPG